MVTEENIKRTKQIILEIVNRKYIFDSIELHEFAEEILNISYSIGGGYDEGTIREIAQIKVKEIFNI
jgi:hypothetical protein